MPKLIKDGAIVTNDEWLPMDPEGTAPRAQHILSLEQWMTLDDKANSAVQLEPGEPPAPLLNHLDELALVAVNFPAFTDGRGFSCSSIVHDCKSGACPGVVSGPGNQDRQMIRNT